VSLKDLRREDRPLVRLIKKGPSALSNVELLAIIFGKSFKYKGKIVDSLEVAKKVLKKYSLKQLANTSLGELKKIFGIGTVRAAHIQAMFELMKRFNSYREEIRPKIERPKDVYEILLPEFYGLKQEIVKVVLLDSRNRIIKTEEITRGTVDTNIIHPREVFRVAIENSASSIILVHNHPSGDPEPSDEDLRITKRLVRAGKILGIKVQDHVIIGERNYFSMRERKLI